MARGDARAAADKWLKDQGIIAELDERQLELVRQLIGSASFGIFWGMLRFRREESAIALSNASLGSPQNDAAASVLQGSIRCIDGVRELILEIAEPTNSAADEEEQ